MDHESYLIRQVSSVEELRESFSILGAQFTPPITAKDGRLEALVRRFPMDRSMMLVVEQDGRIIGGALGFESTLRIIALESTARGKGLGRRLLQTFEVMAMRQGVTTISLATNTVRDFYIHMGYHGKSSLHKELPLPGRVHDLILKRLESLIGDLSVGQVLETDAFGRVPPLR